MCLFFKKKSCACFHMPPTFLKEPSGIPRLANREFYFSFNSPFFLSLNVCARVCFFFSLNSFRVFLVDACRVVRAHTQRVEPKYCTRRGFYFHRLLVLHSADDRTGVKRCTALSLFFVLCAFWNSHRPSSSLHIVSSIFLLLVPPFS